MASKIPGFTSGLKPPSTSSSLSSLAKRRVPEVTTTQPTEKRPRTTDDAHSKVLLYSIKSAYLMFIVFCFVFTAGPTASKLTRSKSVSSLVNATQKPAAPLSRAPSAVLRSQASTTLNRASKSASAYLVKFSNSYWFLIFHYL